MSKYRGINISRWSLAAILSLQGYLLVGCDAPAEIEAQDPEEEPAEYIDNPGEIKTDVLRLGNKWRMSGVGDAHGNDDWLRLFNIAGTDYWGGFAAGKFWSGQGYYGNSDMRLKADVAPLSTSIEKLLSLRGVEFRWKGDPSSREIGLVAQEVEPVFPELVQTGPKGLKGINYDGLTAVMIEVLKQQQAQIADLQHELQSLRAELPNAGKGKTSR
jgi:hypothetical protein